MEKLMELAIDNGATDVDEDALVEPNGNRQELTVLCEQTELGRLCNEVRASGFAVTEVMRPYLLRTMPMQYIYGWKFIYKFYIQTLHVHFITRSRYLPTSTVEVARSGEDYEPLVAFLDDIGEVEEVTDVFSNATYSQ
jgi:transcriptional/translational regulatory protein YebC/TACO1